MLFLLLFLVTFGGLASHAWPCISASRRRRMTGLLPQADAGHQLAGDVVSPTRRLLLLRDWPLLLLYEYHKLPESPQEA